MQLLFEPHLGPRFTEGLVNALTGDLVLDPGARRFRLWFSFQRVRVLTLPSSESSSAIANVTRAPPIFSFRISVLYPKMSFTLSKIDDPRSAGLFSTLSVAPSCSMSLRCSRVSFVGVSTRKW